MYMTLSRISLLVLTVILMLVVGSGSVYGREQKTVEHFSYLPIIVRPVPRVEDISEPLLIDGVEGRIYARATVDGELKTVVLATDDGRYLDSYEKRGDEWRISERVCVHEGTDSRTATAMEIDAGAFRPGSFDRQQPSRPIGP